MTTGWNISFKLPVMGIRALILLLAVPLLAMFSPTEAKANVVCLIDSAEMNFGTSQNATGTVNYTCTNYGTATSNFALCVKRGRSSSGSNQNPAIQSNGNLLRYHAYKDPATTQVWNRNDPLQKNVSVPGGGLSIQGSFAFYGKIVAGQNATPGNYSGAFNDNRLGSIKPNGRCGVNNNRDRISGQNFYMPVTATVSNDCTISASGDVDFGSVAPSPSALYERTAIDVECPNGTAYTIGLAPSNGNVNGLGVLSGTGANTDQPPYSLHKNGSNGPIWGNTASVGNVGNGVSGTGNGNSQTYGAYVTVPGTEFAPDSYSDTVRVTVHF